jgi:tRNA threonylcarbamoyladenosine biosynthesis protein TsaB
LTYILNIETSTKNCSVGLAKNGEIVALKELNNGAYSHAEKLHAFIQEVVTESAIQFSDLAAIAISKGPGSYTGLRIGVSAAKGLCFALDIPLISVSTLQSLALSMSITNGVIIPVLDARRMEVYSSVFNAENKKLRVVKAEIISSTSFQEYLEKGKVYLIGDGVEKCKGIINHKNAFFIDDKLPSANQMSTLSFKKFKISNFEDVAYFEPFYLKDFVAIKSKK